MVVVHLTGRFVGWIELSELDGLKAENGGYRENIFLRRPSRHVSTRLRQAEQDLAVALGPGEVLHHFGADVAGIEIWKDHHIRLPRDQRVRRLLLGEIR